VQGNSFLTRLQYLAVLNVGTVFIDAHNRPKNETYEVLSMYDPSLRVPIGRIRWAITETAEFWNGYMEGAVRRTLTPCPSWCLGG